MATKDEIYKFGVAIEKFAAEKRLGYMESIVEYCKINGMEVEMAATLVSSNLKAKLREEAMGLNLLKKSKKANKLPL